MLLGRLILAPPALLLFGSAVLAIAFVIAIVLLDGS